MNTKGFTLIELLVTISIMAILGTIGIRVYGISLNNTSDNQRLKDLNSVKQALELYRYDARTYPATLNFSCSSPPSLGFSSKTYLSKLPSDPNCSSGRSYLYRGLECSNGVCTRFVLCAKKEGNKSYTLPAECSGQSCGSVGNCDMGIESS